MRCGPGNAPEVSLQTPLGLVGAVPLTDGIYAVAGRRRRQGLSSIDGSGVVSRSTRRRSRSLWKFATRGGAGNCNNVAAPAVIGKYLHVGTTAGYYYVLDRDTGAVVREIDCREPIFSSPAAGTDRVYFATLGAQVYAVEPDGDARLDLGLRQGGRQVRRQPLERRGLAQAPQGPRHLADHFVCSRDICLVGKTVVMPAGGRTVFLDDAGSAPQLRAVGEIPDLRRRRVSRHVRPKRR